MSTSSTITEQSTTRVGLDIKATLVRKLGLVAAYRGISRTALLEDLISTLPDLIEFNDTEDEIERAIRLRGQRGDAA